MGKTLGVYQAILAKRRPDKVCWRLMRRRKSVNYTRWAKQNVVRLTIFIDAIYVKNLKIMRKMANLDAKIYLVEIGRPGIFKLSKIPLVLLFDKVASNGGGPPQSICKEMRI